MGLDATAIRIVPESPSQWQIVFGGEHDRLRALFSEPSRELSSEERGRVFSTATRILGQCPDPHGPARRATGLALGKVQSGKTLSYTALTALAFDNDYRIVIVLTGRTQALGDQNRDRLYDDLQVASRPTPRIARFDNPSAHDEAELQTVLENNSVALITLLKTQDRIGDLCAILQISEISQHPTLIIDDEADQASHNTRRYKGGQSTIYSHILRLRGALPHHAYVAYTATPQANLLADTIDELSPEFCVLIEPGSGYTGGAVFFGPERDKYLRIIPDDEANSTQIDGVPDYLRLAIATFLVAGAFLHRRQPQAFHAMLIHHSSRKDEHQRLHAAVQALVDGWRQALDLPESDPGAQRVLSLARRAYEDLRQTATNRTEWPVIRAQLREEIRAKVWLVNSLPQGKNPSRTPFNLMNNIMIGGNMLDRGVTIRGLAVTYITRQAKNSQADTIEQRARWFGYKRKYLDLCRIFTSQRIVDIYAELLSHEDDFWDSLRRNEAQGIPVKQWPRFFRLGLDLRPTRASVARVKAFKRTDWIVQRHVETGTEAAARDVAQACRFFSEHPDARLEPFGSRKHRVISGCDPEQVIELIAQLSVREEQDWDSSYVMEYLERLVIANRLTGFDVLLMGDGEVRERTPSRQGTDTYNPQEGATSKYPGDRYLVADRMQLQVHIIATHPTKADPPSEPAVALALYTPPGPDYDLGSIVVPSD